MSNIFREQEESIYGTSKILMYKKTNRYVEFVSFYEEVEPGSKVIGYVNLDARRCAGGKVGELKVQTTEMPLMVEDGYRRGDAVIGYIKCDDGYVALTQKNVKPIVIAFYAICFVLIMCMYYKYVEKSMTTPTDIDIQTESVVDVED